jgi:hypothetical protein
MGLFLTKWGINGTGDGQFDYTTGVATDASGNVYVADRFNHRIQKFGLCSFSTVPDSRLIGFAGGTDSFDVDANVEACGWAVTSGQPWIQVTSADAGIGDGTVTYSVDPNPAAFLRQGTITLADQTTSSTEVTFTVTQDPAPCTYSIVPTEASFPDAGGSGGVTVSTVAGCTWTAVSNDSWITVTSGTPGNGPGTVEYNVAANDGSTTRVGSLTIAGESLTVNQDPQVPDTPTNLAGVAMSSSKVKLTWTDNAANETEIRVERKLGATGAFAQIATLPSDTTGYTDTGLQRRTEYVYRVMACNSAGCSAPSAEVTVTTPALGIFIGEEP